VSRRNGPRVLEPQPSSGLRLPGNAAGDFDSIAPQQHDEYRQHLPVATYDRCFVTHTGIGIKHLRLIEETAFSDADFVYVNRQFHRYGLYKWLSEPRVRLGQGNLLLLHNHWSSGYFHWLTECLVKAQFIDPAEHVVILPEDYPSFAQESLAMLPFAGIVRIPAGRGVRAARLTVVSNPHSGRFNPAHVAWLRRYFVERCGAASGTAERIYVTRRSEPRRRVANEEKVVSLLRQYDFEVLDARDLSFGQQVRAFAQCKVLVSVHGAGLSNCVFMPPGSRVLEFYPDLGPGQGMNACYWHLSSSAGLTYYYQFCRHRQVKDEIGDVDVVVDTEKLQRNIELMLA
jgi:capsular polysaccharide biosynthesis protein